jgi:hypothetical protein
MGVSEVVKKWGSHPGLRSRVMSVISKTYLTKRVK